MRILLTGHRGYIDTVMGPILAAAGHDVVGLDADFYEACTFVGPMPEIPTLRRDVQPRELEGFDAVVHLAALSNDPLGDLNPGAARFVLSSSCSNYWAAGDAMVDERSELNPVTPYGVSKVRAERDIAALHPH